MTNPTTYNHDKCAKKQHCTRFDQIVAIWSYPKISENLPPRNSENSRWGERNRDSFPAHSHEIRLRKTPWMDGFALFAVEYLWNIYVYNLPQHDVTLMEQDQWIDEGISWSPRISSLLSVWKLHFCIFIKTQCSCRSRPKRHKIVKTDESGNRRRSAGSGNAFCRAWTDWMPCAWYIALWDGKGWLSHGVGACVLASRWFHDSIVIGKVCGFISWPWWFPSVFMPGSSSSFLTSVLESTRSQDTIEVSGLSQMLSRVPHDVGH